MDERIVVDCTNPVTFGEGGVSLVRPADAALGFDAHDAGSLANAFALEGLALLWMHGAMTEREGRRSSFALQRAT